jgi:hypothetical protein
MPSTVIPPSRISMRATESSMASPTLGGMTTPKKMMAPPATRRSVDRRGGGGALMAAHHLMVGAVVFANEETILMSDGTLFLVPAGMRLPHYPAGTTLVIEYEILKGRNVLAHVPEIEGEAS